MTTLTSAASAVIGGVDTHAEVHVAAACAASARSRRSGSRAPAPRVGLTRFLLAAGVEVTEVLRPNRQTRRRHGKTDVIDAVAAARAGLTGEATGKPRAHDGAVAAVRLLTMVHRSAHTARTQAQLQIPDLITTARTSWVTSCGDCAGASC